MEVIMWYVLHRALRRCWGKEGKGGVGFVGDFHGDGVGDGWVGC